MKKFSIILFKFFCLLLFLVSIPASSFIVVLYSDNIFIDSLVPFLGLFLLLPSLWKLYPSWSYYKKIGVHAIGVLSLIVILQIGLTIRENSLGQSRYSYQLGNNLGIYRLFTQNDISQNLLKKTLSVLPYSTQYMIYAAEDASRVFKIQKDFKRSEFKEALCQEQLPFDCFKNIYVVTNNKAAFSSTGSILMLAVGATIIFSEKKKNDTRSSFGSALNIMELTQLIKASINSVEKIIPDFPNDEVAKIPDEVKSKISSVNLSENVSDLLFGISLPELDTKLRESVLEAYLLKKTDEEIIGKLDTASTKKINGIAEAMLKKLDKKDVKSELKKEELVYYRTRIQAYIR